MDKFEICSKFKPTGDQPNAINELVAGIKSGKRFQTLLGVTGSGKTFTMANIIEKVNKPTLVFVHNKTLAGQLYSELKEFFPNNHVEYFVSNFDYYQPEAYIPSSDMYIDKTATTNEELDMLRTAAANSVLERRDTIIVASVACIYGASNPDTYRGMFYTIRVGDIIDRAELFKELVARQYKRNDLELSRGCFRARGDNIEIALGHSNDYILRIEMFDDEIDRIVEVDPLTGKTIKAYSIYVIHPATGYATPKEKILSAVEGIKKELDERLSEFRAEDKLLEAERLEQRTRYDMEALVEFGVCPGIENYSRHLDGRKEGATPYTLIDYFPDDFLLLVDESHVSLPQIRGMFNGDRARKQTLVDFGFRLPSALDNRPLRFEEFEDKINQAVFVSATPGEYELEKSHGEIVEQIIRPTGLLDPEIDVRRSEGQIDDLVEEIRKQIDKNERTLITTLTVQMAEDLSNYLKQLDISVAWLHHEVKTIERTEIIRDLRLGKYDVLIGINLLREGLDIPEVSLIAILDADKEGFLRSERSLIQIIGRAARNANGRVIMYADNMTKSMEAAIEETKRRRKIQIQYNKEHGIEPKTIIKPIRDAIHSVETKELSEKYIKSKKVNKKDKAILIKDLEKEMKEAAKNLEFERAAELRDMLLEIRND